MNKNIERIRKIDSQIKAIKKILADGSYMGAGLTVGITVGALEDNNFDLVVSQGIAGEPTALLNLVLDGLRRTRRSYLGWVSEELAELDTFRKEYREEEP